MPTPEGHIAKLACRKSNEEQVAQAYYQWRMLKDNKDADLLIALNNKTEL